MLHVSEAFPSHWVIVLEGALVFLGLLLAAVSFPPLVALGRWIARALRAMGRRPRLSIVAIAVTAGLVLAVQCAIVGPPYPHVVDEWSYLLAADTFAHNRITNPPHPMAAHFDAPHVLQHPTYASKYPPAQGFVLAIGQVAFGHPAAGLWISAVLLVAAMGWMLLEFVPGSWAVFGAVLVALRLGAGGYWNQTYWGGSMAAVGGALLLAAVRRLSRRASWGGASLLAIALAVLANSRPFEGFLVAIPAAIVLTIGLVRTRLGPHAWTRFVLPLAAMLALVALGMARYDRSVVGDPFHLPHEVHRSANHIPVFFWQAETTAARAAPLSGASDGRAVVGSASTSLRYAAYRTSEGVHRMAVVLFFFLGLPATLSLLLTPAAVRDPWSRIATASFLAVSVGHVLILPWFAHYAAPATAAVLLLGVQGQRLARCWRRPRLGVSARRMGRAWFGAACLIQLASFAFQLPAYRADPAAPSRQRARLAWELEHRPGEHLLLVRYPSGLGNDWTYNGADVDGAKVVWANDLGAARNAELLRYYPDRTVWSIDADFTARDPLPVLVRAAQTPVVTVPPTGQ
jgi:hypothetical protein